MKSFLITYDDGTVRRLSIDEDVSRFTVGREKQNNIVIHDDRMSREHGVFEVSLDGIVYRDSSRNGSLVNGRVVKNSAVWMYPGDSIELFGAMVLYENDGTSSDTTGRLSIESDTPSVPIMMQGISPQRRLLAAVVIILILSVVAITLVFFIKERREFRIDPEGTIAPTGTESVDTGISMADEIPGLMILEFYAGIIAEEDDRFVILEETTTIPRVPGTLFGVCFRYDVINGEPVEYFQDEQYPSFPNTWEGWSEGSGAFTPFPDAHRAEYRTTLSPEEDAAARVWYVDEEYPLGEMTWEVYFNDVLYRTITFTVVE
ncbi:MAG: FHA domain-containing protein [Deltaproteobacteria bacterium]|nr:FHA domain-containing protein [Candidatus Zymogenaceae bacterium]